ncbi:MULTISPECIES: lipopolysaccharide assembly protein LapA domain-containing protein [Caldisericum]|jgi:cytoskeletal protein RodZ|uniref:lipopolysaccharide assembly protein LapA domain-containing protein n=1 Tax=Caldisericum TaxID=693074 RepID=UPI003C71AE61
MKKIGALLIVLLVLSGISTWFLLLNISYFTSVNLFGYMINNVTSGTLVIVSFILGGILIWFISFIAYNIEIQQLKAQIQKTAAEQQSSKKEEEQKGEK